MRNTVEIENIEEMRREQGIDDVELRQEIRGLKRGDVIKLTLLTGRSSETLSVRITSIKGLAIRGKLVAQPAIPGPAKLRVGSPIVFTTAHIHSTQRRTVTEPLRSRHV